MTDTAITFEYETPTLEEFQGRMESLMKLDKDIRKNGLGRKHSAQFHEHMGFRFVGTFQNCGYKFGRWYHMVFMEKLIGEHVTRQREVTWFPDL